MSHHIEFQKKVNLEKKAKFAKFMTPSEGIDGKKKIFLK